MINKIIEGLISDANFLTLNFLDTVAGVIRVHKQKFSAEGENWIVKTYPVYKQTETQCNKGHYKDLVPDSNKMSILYFEHITTEKTLHTANWQEYKSLLNLVFWCNLKKINKNLEDAETLAELIKQNLPKCIPDFTGHTFIRVYSNEYIHNPDIFSKYSYMEEDNQYLMYPFDYFALGIEITYRIVPCQVDVIIDPAVC